MLDNDEDEVEVETFLDNRRAVEQATRASRIRNSPNRNGGTKIRGVDPTTSQIDYTHSEIEFMNAMQAYKTRTGRMFPTHRETLRVLRSLGYQQVGTVA